MSDATYIIDGYSIMETMDGVQVFKDDEWVGSQETRQAAITWIYKMRTARLAP